MIPANYSPEDVEKEVSEFWEKNRIYEKSKKRKNKQFFFVDGPPYTTGRIHLGTAWNKIIKDVVLRYKRMRGYNVLDMPGWDMHGLPIEVKVEQELGFKTKRDIEEYGIDSFIEKCMKYSLENKDLMTKQFKMLGVWMDWDNPYMTIKADYINAAWWTVKRAYEQNLLEQKKMVVNWCPRCETALADAEVEYWDEEDPSIFVKFPVHDNSYIVIWTTTPWTLPANMAVAVHPALEYAQVKAFKEGKIEYLIVAKELAESVLKKGGYELWEIVETFLGEDLVGIKYQHPLSDEVPIQKNYEHRVYMADFVSAENTGCVHVAPGHGLEDYELGIQHGIEVFNPVDDRGIYTEKAGKYAGKPVKEANAEIIDDLRNKGLLLAEDKIVHRYGHCWRCKNPIIYRATEQWFLRVSNLKEKMLEEIDKVKWIPEWAGMSRFKDWVSNAKDWCISRQRYWGIPIPVWKCEKCGSLKVIGDVKEIELKDDLDLHRPKVDSIVFDCECSGKMYRVNDVFDVWFDSGVASWGTLSYPLHRENFEKLWPADFITEGHDQTRGWFYSQLGTSVIAFGKAPYRTVLMHGFTLDEQGRKMSKSLGNVVEPDEVVKKVGVDCFRLYVLSSALWEDLRFSWDEVKNFNRILNIFWNAVRFAHIYMSLDKFREVEIDRETLNIEDKWILSKVENLNRLAIDSLDNYQLHRIVRAFHNFAVEDFSRWYIQLIRNRVWEEKDSPSKIAAYSTILRVVDKTIRIIAPYAPYIAEWIYQHFIREFRDAEESVFLENYPKPGDDFVDVELENCMVVVRELYEAVSNARQKAKIKLRWPLRRLLVETSDEDVKNAVERLADLIKAQCNIKEVEVVNEFEKKITVKPNFKAIGSLLKEKARDFASYLNSLSEEEIKRILESDEIEFEGVRLKQDDVLIKEYKLPEGYEISEFSRGSVYLYTIRDEELVKESYAREVTRRIQEMRKELNLNVDEFIEVCIDIPHELVKGWSDYIKTETRAKKLEFSLPEDGYIKEWEIEDKKVKIGLRTLWT
ncbi:MAG TPA: isoleucine--tRNA ligase [Archaeoglobaceae archaeon]|nr:isoleucine--tRNA ligase [Archaeoglobaceae archaeon]